MLSFFTQYSTGETLFYVVFNCFWHYFLIFLLSGASVNTVSAFCCWNLFWLSFHVVDLLRLPGPDSELLVIFLWPSSGARTFRPWHSYYLRLLSVHILWPSVSSLLTTFFWYYSDICVFFVKLFWLPSVVLTISCPADDVILTFFCHDIFDPHWLSPFVGIFIWFSYALPSFVGTLWPFDLLLLTWPSFDIPHSCGNYCQTLDLYQFLLYSSAAQL